MSVTSREIIDALDWTKRIYDFFRPYKSEIRKLRLNYKEQTSEIRLLIYIPDTIKRKVSKIEVPAYSNFYIHEMMDETFVSLPVAELWKYKDGKWILKPTSLPSSEKFFLSMRGFCPREVISKIVRVQEARNRDQTEEEDRYWLDCMIRDVELLEKVWTALEVEDVDVDVRVGIDRCFSSAIPRDYRKKIDAVQEYLAAGYSRDREKVGRAWRRLRLARRIPGVSVDDLMDLIMKLTSGELFATFVSVDPPYNLGAIKREEKFRGPFPERMMVEALTDLNLKQYTATGYLTFKKKKYIDKIKETIEK